MFDIEKRVQVIEAVAAKYTGRPLVLGSDDCVHMIAFGLKEYGIKTGLSKYGDYTTPAGARRALRKAGYMSLTEAVSGHGFFELDAPAMAWPGDIIAMPSDDDEHQALAWMASNGRAFGNWNGIFQYFQPLAFKAAWRVA